MAHIFTLLFGKAFKWVEILFEVFYQSLIDNGLFKFRRLTISLEDQEDDIPKEVFFCLEILFILNFLYL